MQWVVLTCRLSRVTTDVWDPLVEVAGNQLARERTSNDNDMICDVRSMIIVEC